MSKEALQDLLEAVDLAIYSGDWKVDGACDPDVAIQRARDVLAQPEPWEKFCDSNCVWTDHHPDCKMAQRKPLTNEEIYKASTEAKMQEHYMGFHSGFIRFARAIEAAHGIKGEA